MNVELLVRVTAGGAEAGPSPRHRFYLDASALEEETAATNPALHLMQKRVAAKPSAWSCSTAKRVFDCVCVLVALPALAPILLLIAAAVRLTSAGPVFFRQKRVGSFGRFFTILKFRTMIHDVNAAYHAVTTDGNQPFTSIGPFLRRWKLDELPQVLNVLSGDMSLVGPRPKMAQHAVVPLPCRPGITGAATIAFAREESLLDQLPAPDLEAYYHHVVLPAKAQLDSEYMARATFSSDLKLIVKSALRRWDDSIARRLLNLEELKADAFSATATGRDVPPWKSGIPVRVATFSVRVDTRRSA